MRESRYRRRRSCKDADAVLLGAVGAPEFDQADVRPLIARELVGGLYYGPRGRRGDGTVYDTCEYHPARSSESRAPSSRRVRAAGT